MLNTKNILDLHYQQDAQGATLLCTADGPYTGVVLETLPSGYITTAYEVKDGLKDGVEKEFFSADEVEHVAHYRKGFLHGEVVYYYPEGGPKEKSVFEYGICLEEFQWDETGKLTHHQVLELPKYQQVMLENNRKEYGS
jgi:antitoxin component YwqK of YwqJK toxin-antitoxin module